MQAAFTQGSAPPVGVWTKMYSYIFGLINAEDNAAALQAPQPQQYWFQQAAFINNDQEGVPAGYFVRDVTAIGMGVSGPSDPAVQSVSNAIGWVIYQSILTTGKLPAFWQQLNADIYSSLQGLPSGDPDPYSYPSLQIGSWGGTFYYWNAPYDPNGSPTEKVPPSTSISQYILGNTGENATFITNYSLATANTLIRFQTTIPDPSQVLRSIWSAAGGIENIWNSGWQGKVDVALLVAQTIIDYQLQGGLYASALQSGLSNYVEN